LHWPTRLKSAKLKAEIRKHPFVQGKGSGRKSRRFQNKNNRRDLKEIHADQAEVPLDI
jgi:hypothetical protein